MLISFCFASFIFESRITVLYHSTIESGTWVVSQSTRGILSRTFKHFGIEPEYVGCFNLFHRKPHIRNLQKALEKLGLQTDTIDHPMELIKYLQ